MGPHFCRKIVSHHIVSNYVCGVSKVWHQGILKAAVFGVFEDLKFKISGGLDQN